ncbi:MAG: UvrD-helicase domain-containing protein [Phycisphaerales bacterium]|nr:MAG: UvrD-helicase domain-containing protein [Phycisphaerales bacterium]
MSDSSAPPETDVFAGLTAPQKEAVGHVDGPLLVLAGPGSGKTTVVTRRVAHLISQGIPPWQILALTFTNKAAGEMRDRIERLLPDELIARRGLTVATFHSFCARLLRRYAQAAGLDSRFSIYDAADQRDAIKQALKAADLSSRNFTPGAVASAISNAKNRLLDAAGYAAEAGDFYTRSIARAFTAYEKVLRVNDALDFDDLLLVTARLLRDDESVRGELQRRHQYLLIDEYQDTNHAQFVIAAALAAQHRNICVVGDPDQSIYGWRGADIRNILEFEEQYPDASVIALGRNFRSTGHIVSAADQLIRHNTRRKHKPLSTELGDGEKPTVIVCRHEHHEAEMIVDEFRRRREENATPWKDMAVLYRINALSRVLEEAFRDAQVPYIVARGTAFYERKEIKDALSYLRLIANPNDEVALRRIVNTPPRGIGKTSLDTIELFALNHQMRFFDAMRAADRITGLTARAIAAVGRFVRLIESWREFATSAGESDDARLLDTEPPSILAELVERVVRESGMEKLYRNSKSEEDLARLENLEELISAASEFVPTVDERAETDGEGRHWAATDLLQAYLESVALVADADSVDPASGAVTLMTLHTAKGLEFEVVAVAGLENGLLPHLRATTSDAELEEERRLCFVGMTRAKRHLLMTRAAVRTHRGIRERTIESPFLHEIPTDSVITSDQAMYLDDIEDAEESWRPRPCPRKGAGRRPRTAVEASLIADPDQPEITIGCLVRHPKFGLGRVEAIMRRPVGSSARIAFQSAGTKTLMLEYARLKRVE